LDKVGRVAALYVASSAIGLHRQRQRAGVDMRGAAAVLASVVLSTGMLAAQGPSVSITETWSVFDADAPTPQGRGRGGAAAHTPAYWIKISAEPDGTFTIANNRNGFSKTYATRAKRS